MEYAQNLKEIQALTRPVCMNDFLYKKEHISSRLDGYKQCSKCKKQKLLESFKKDKRSKTGFSAQCRNCHNLAGKQRYHKRKTKRCNVEYQKKLKNKLESEVKQCSVCKQWKFLADFKRSIGSTDGFGYHCKACHNKKTAEYRKANPEKIKARYRKIYQQNKEEYRAKWRKFYAKNKDKDYIRMNLGRVYRNAKFYNENITKLSKKQLYLGARSVIKNLHYFENTPKYKLMRETLTLMFLEYSNRGYDGWEKIENLV